MRASHEHTVCQRAGAVPLAPRPRSKLGLALSTTGMVPINGVRHMPTEETSGWYLWCGDELSGDPDVFAPVHVEHLAEYMPDVIESPPSLQPTAGAPAELARWTP